MAVSKHLGETEASQRKILGVDNVTQDERGLRSLIAAGCYRAAVNLTGRLLTIYGQGFGRAGQPAKHSPHSLQLWFTRLALLAKLGEFELLQKEAEPFDQLNRPDVYYEVSILLKTITISHYGTTLTNRNNYYFYLCFLTFRQG